MRSQRLRRFPFQYRFLALARRVEHGSLSVAPLRMPFARVSRPKHLPTIRCLFTLHYLSYSCCELKRLGTCFDEANENRKKKSHKRATICQNPHISAMWAHRTENRTRFRWNRKSKTRSGKEDVSNRKKLNMEIDKFNLTFAARIHPFNSMVFGHLCIRLDKNWNSHRSSDFDECVEDGRVCGRRVMWMDFNF